MTHKQVTVKDLGRRLNLHFTTVSKALHNHPDISEQTKRSVILLAEKLGYHPNSIAKNLKSRKTYTLGVIVPLIENDFFSAVISGVEEVAYGRNFNTIVCQSNEDTEREAIHVRTLTSNRVAGVLVSVSKTTTSGAHFRPLQKQGIPLVFFDRFCEDIEADKVVVNDYDGATQAVRHLVHCGYKRIAHLAGSTNTSIGRDRCRGYVDELKRNGIEIDPEMIVCGGFQERDGVSAFRTLLSRDRMPDAIFAVNDPVAIGAYKEIKRKNLKIPKDIALAGFGDNTLSSYLDPPLTTVMQSPYKMGKIAADMLLRRIENSESEIESKVEVIETKLIIRRST
jgi:DNA-binding LacI/PurR family transcriptional regulator